MSPDVIDLTNGSGLPRWPPALRPQRSEPVSVSSLLFGAGSREAFLRSTATNALLATSTPVPPSISSATSTSSSPLYTMSTTTTSTLGEGATVGGVDKALIYAPNFPNYIMDNVTLNSLPRQIFQWSQQSQYGQLNGTSGSAIDWDSGQRNSLYGDVDGDPGPGMATVGQASIQGTCDDVYVSENGMTYQVTVYCMYITIFVLALLGNGVVCYIVQSSPRMRTVTNYFICNLAIGDILMSLFCVPFSFISILILGYWPFGAILCHLVNYSQAISVLVSAYTLVAISVDRYIVIMWPLRPRITKR